MGKQAFRTEEEIQHQLDARLRELEIQAKTFGVNVLEPSTAKTCLDCRFITAKDTDGYIWKAKSNIESYGRCDNPLIKGFSTHGPKTRDARLCGSEKALYRPKLKLWQSFYNWFGDPFGWIKY